MGSDGGPEGVLMGCRNIKGGGVQVSKGPETSSGRGVKGCPYGGPSECREGISWGSPMEVRREY